MKQISEISGTAIPLLLDDIDTDRIIPARFLLCVTFEGLGDHAFEDDRIQNAEHPFNQEQYRNASILVAGHNFGCGSSREHAPQSLHRWGIKGIIAGSFAEIFFGNCLSLGIPAVTAAAEDLQQVAQAIEANPNLHVTINLPAKQVRYGTESIPCEIPDSVAQALIQGEWDFLEQLLEGKEEICHSLASLPYLNSFETDAQ